MKNQAGTERPVTACALYPGGSLFLENVREEAVQNIRRLRNHPCLALWCGNNEIKKARNNRGRREQFGWTKELNLPRPEIRRTVTGTTVGCRIEPVSPVLAKDVYLRVDGVDGRFSDDFFDLLPGEGQKVIIFTSGNIYDVSPGLTITSLIQSY